MPQYILQYDLICVVSQSVFDKRFVDHNNSIVIKFIIQRGLILTIIITTYVHVQ